MSEKPPKICPHCGKREHEEIPVDAKEEPHEYDHRGMMMPQRTRLGGIIIPQ